MTRRKLVLSTLGGLAATGFAAASNEGSELIGKTAPPLGLTDWINSPPLEMMELRGKVVLLRWWTDGCPFCEATAPALRKLNSTFQSRGLEVIGVYHPKPAKKGDLQKVRQAVVEKQFSFPVAVDWQWGALRRWWLFQARDFTSVSFLVDRQGVIRYIQPGGEYHEGEQGGMPTHVSCQRDFAVIRKSIEQLLVT